MSTLDELVAAQDVNSINIQKAIANFKKSPKDRLTTEYLEKKIKELDELWVKFNTVDNVIRRDYNIQEDHPYIIKDIHSSIGALHNEARINMIELLNALKLSKPSNNSEVSTQDIHASSAKPGPSNTTNQRPRPSSQAILTQNKLPQQSIQLMNKIQKQKRVINVVTRMIDEIIQDENQHSSQYYESKLKVIEHHWKAAQDLHDKIFDELDDINVSAYKFEEFLELETTISNKILTIQEKVIQPIDNCETIKHLPKVTLPQFNGDYLQWRQFYDIFNEMIHKKPLPKIQKMWYLKTNLRGEAEKLIRHFSLTEENYEAAWTMLKDRFNNLRLLTSALLDKLLGQVKQISDAPSVAAVKGIHDTTQETLSALKALGVNTTAWDPILIHILIKKLDKATHILYEQSLENPRELPSLSHFLKFLETRFQSLEAVGQKERPAFKSLTSIVSNEQNSQKCKSCNGKPHPLYACQRFLELAVNKRLQFLKQNKMCINCLKPGHVTKDCTSRNCTKCNYKHNTLVHFENTNMQTPENQPNTQRSTTLTASDEGILGGYVLLSTAIVRLVANNGQSIECRAILDSGSQVNLITERAVRQLGVQVTPSAMLIEGVGNGKKEARNRINVNLQSKIGQFSTRLEAFVLPQIISHQPTKQLDTSTWAIPENINLADPKFNQPAKIDLLIGAEFYNNLLTSGKLSLRNGLPTLHNTVFGWILSGKVKGYEQWKPTCGVCTEADDDLNNTVKKFWQLEEVLPEQGVLSTSEKWCENYFSNSTIRSHEGRFMVRIPFTDSTATLGESKQIALNRFYALERRLAKDINLKEQYIQFMNEYESLKHMTKIDIKNISGKCYFIPHHCVLRPESTTTKLRVVFDASCKTSSGLALNDIMHTGPIIQQELMSILLRFRCPKFVFTSDIQKMYRQILIHPEDRKYQLIIWRANNTKEVQYYQLNTVTYGTRAAPYLATKCLQQLGKNNISQHPLGARALLNDFYVDDCLTGSNSLTEAIETQNQLKQILGGAGFVLRKWCANHPQLLQDIPIEDQEVNLDFSNDVNNTVKTLGLTWVPKSDDFCIKVNLTTTSTTTKRSIVSDTAKIYDPLGLLGPVVVSAKILIQQLWKEDYSWDEQLSAELCNKWKAYREKLNNLNNLHIPRHVLQQGTKESLQIHAFADASERAYGTAVYIRSVCKNGTVIVRLLVAKSRVAPLKAQSIPRLELCAALLSSQLVTRVKEDLQLGDAPTYFWTDSQVVLAWINANSTSYQTFVANRIAKIQELTSANQWRHVSSKSNPADVLSRGLSPSEFKRCDLWFYGPLFLHGKPEFWPAEYSRETGEEINLERKRKATVLNISTPSGLEEMIYQINHRNSFKSLVHIVAYVLRFAEHARTQNKDRITNLALTPNEQKNALTTIIRAIQRSDFSEEAKLLNKGKAIHKTSQLSSLNPFIDNEGIIRIGGRLEAANISYNAKHPMVLPYNDGLVKLLFKWFHEEHLHCGPQNLLAHIRQQFWPIKGKTIARSTVQHCYRCTKVKPKLFNQIMGNLPATRIQPARPFVNAGVDFCGPFWIHFRARGKRPHKAYVAVFCCFSTKAVHLEIVSDLTTEAFIGCLKRFIARRGHCQNLYCDNATNFVGAKNQLLELKEVIHTKQAQHAITRISSDKGIKFNFIPPRAPHFGGLWEAAVKSAKNLFVRSVSNASLTYEELETVMVEIEAILNSRPLTPISTDPNDLTALTPGHFLIGEPLTSQIDTTAIPTKMNLLTRWKLVSHMKHEFWQRWSRDYLNELQFRQKWREQADNVQPHQMVVIKEDNLPPLQWPLGRIIKTYKGNDNMVRVADIRTSNGICKRPIHRLAPLPTPDVIENTEPSQIASDPINTNNDREELPIKRSRRTLHSNLGIALTILLILPVVLSNTIKIQKFNPEAGIHFESIGSTKIKSSEWNLVIYYNLEPLHEELQVLSTGTNIIKNLCHQLNDNTYCSKLISQLQGTSLQLHLDNSLLESRRQKRGAINLVGNVARSLFGVLDSEYSDKMSETICAVQNNEEHLLKLLKDQTSIVDSTINIIKHDQLMTAKTFEELESRLAQIINSEKTNEININESKLFQVFTSLALQLTLTSSNVQRIQSSIIDVLTNVHHGQISPLLLSPAQLQKEITKLSTHLPPNLQFPGYHGNLLSIYKLMTVRSGITAKHAIFKIAIPLIGPEQFNLYKLIPIPTIMNKSIVAIKTSTPILGITLHRDKYFPMDAAELTACDMIEELEYLCPNTKPIYNKGAAKCACEISLFNNEKLPICEFHKLDGNIWMQTNQRNQWIFAVDKPMQITAICGNQVSQIPLNGSGFVQLEPDCVVKHDMFSITGNQVWTSSTSGSYTSFGNISELVKPSQQQLLHVDHHEQKYEAQLKELSTLQKLIASQDILELPNRLQSSNHHSFAIGYTALILIILIIIVLAIQYKRRRKGQPPQPLPRTKKENAENPEFITTF